MRDEGGVDWGDGGGAFGRGDGSSGGGYGGDFVDGFEEGEGVEVVVGGGGGVDAGDVELLATVGEEGADGEREGSLGSSVDGFECGDGGEGGGGGFERASGGNSDKSGGGGAL